MPKSGHTRHIRRVRLKSGKTLFYWQPPARDRHAFGIRRLDDDPAIAWRQADQLNGKLDVWRLKRNRPSGPAPDSVRALIKAYFASRDFNRLAPRTQRDYRGHLEWLDGMWGGRDTAQVTAPLVQALKDRFEDTPRVANYRVAVISALFNYGRRNGLVAHNPAVEPRRLKMPPRRTFWTPDMDAALLAVARPSIRLAFLLALYTAQREGDVIGLRWSDYDGGHIRLVQGKTRVVMTIPVFRRLGEELDLTPRVAERVLVSERTGRPYSEDHFRHAFAEDRKAAGLTVYLPAAGDAAARIDTRATPQFMDLRRTCVVRLAEEGANEAQIIAMTGHTPKSAANIMRVYLATTGRMAERAVRLMENWDRDESTRSEKSGHTILKSGSGGGT